MLAYICYVYCSCECELKLQNTGTHPIDMIDMELKANNTPQYSK